MGLDTENSSGDDIITNSQFSFHTNINFNKLVGRQRKQHWELLITNVTTQCTDMLLQSDYWNWKKALLASWVNHNISLS